MSYPYVTAAPYLDGRYVPYQQNNVSQFYPQQSQQMTSQTEPGIICRPVASIEEAKAIPTDFNGNLMVLPDVSHGMIHTKQLNYQDGRAIFKTYLLNSNEPKPEEPPAMEFASVDDLESLKVEIARLKEQLNHISASQEKPKTTTRGGTDK